jgi:hypothetical protein
VRPEGIGKFKNWPHWESNPRPSGLYRSALTTMLPLAPKQSSRQINDVSCADENTNSTSIRHPNEAQPDKRGFCINVSMKASRQLRHRSRGVDSPAQSTTVPGRLSSMCWVMTDGPMLYK